MMEVRITAGSQEEYDLKKSEFLKALVGIAPLKPRRAVHKFQNEMMDHFDVRFKHHLEEIKKRIEKVLNNHRSKNENSN